MNTLDEYKLITSKVLPGSSIYSISSAVIWKAELDHPKNLKAGCLILRQKSFWPLPEHSQWPVFSSSASTHCSSILTVSPTSSQMHVSGAATVQAIPRKFIFQKDQWNANDMYWQISVEKVFQILPSSGCQRGFTVGGTFPLGTAPLSALNWLYFCLFFLLSLLLCFLCCLFRFLLVFS